MADKTPGELFLDELTFYVDLRLREKDEDWREDPPRHEQFMAAFKKLLESRDGGNPKRAIFQSLVAHMAKMKGSRGGGQPPPGQGGGG